MKTMKKFVSLALALMMALALMAPAFAEEGGDAAETGSITVNNATPGKKFIAYRIFDLTYAPAAEGEEPVVAYTINAAWSGFFADGAAGAGYIVDAQPDGGNLNQIVIDGAVKYINITESNVADFANAAQAYVNTAGNGVESEAVAEGKTSVTISGLELGYYLVFPEGAEGAKEGFNSMCSLTSTVPDGEVVVKAEYPTINKTVNANENKTVEVGQILTYTVTGKVPDYTGYDTYTYTVSDKMSDGLTFNKDVTVKVGGEVIDDATTDYDTVANGFTVTIPVKNYTIGADIEITYTATVNENAICRVNENEAKLVYSNDPSDGTKTSETPPVIVKVYTAQIVIDKYAGTVDENGNVTPPTEDSKRLEGAEFVLADADPTVEGAEVKYYKWVPAAEGATDDPATAGVDESVGHVEWVADRNEATKAVTDVNGAAGDFKGLPNGIYYLVETKAPAGYNLMTTPQKVEITITETEGAVVETSMTATAQVANLTGGLLPSTGGIGTTIFYVVGGVLVAGAAILLMTRKRVRDEE